MASSSAVTGGPTPTTSALDIVEKAFQDLDKCVTPNDSRQFSSTTLQGVRDAAIKIEEDLAARQKYCNIRRLSPLLDGLNHYSKVIDVLCNGTAYLPWIWAPIKLILQVCTCLLLLGMFPTKV
jgi:hypothetical protein